MAKYSGLVDQVSDALVDGWTGMGNIYALRIGNRVLRNVRTDVSLHALLTPGEEAELSLGRLLWWRWLLRVETRCQAHRHGILLFLFANVAHALAGGTAIGLASALIVKSTALQSDIAVLGGLALVLLNVKAWLR